MKQYAAGSSRFVFALLATLLGIVSSAQAGPPLICHAISIGSAKSLPWVSETWNLSGSENYNLNNLVPDTLAILTADTPVLVRMETLRRATIYARQDPRVAKELLTKLYVRATNSDTSGRPDALAWFDAGYLVECYKQWIGQNLPHMTDGMRMDRNPAAGLDGYAWVEKAIGVRGSDAQMEFAAALISLNGSRADHQRHAQNAIAGSKNDPLLAENLASRYLDGGSVAEAFTKVTTAKN